MENVTKERNHYIPRTYLEKFLSPEGKMFVYKKGGNFFKNNITKEQRLLKIESPDALSIIAVKRNLYIPEGNITEDKNIFEDFFNQEVEAKYNEFIDFVEANFFDAQEIFKKYKDYIILLIASMMSRTLHSRTEMEDVHKVNMQMYHRFQANNPSREEELKRHLKEKFPEITEEEATEQIKEYQEMIEEGEFNVKLPRNLFIKHIFENLEMYSEIISDMTIQILRSNGSNYFITSDAPVVYFVPREKVDFYNGPKALGSLFTELYFPLTRNLCLLLTRRNIEVLSGIPVDKEIVDGVNYNLSHNSRDFIFSPSEEDFLKKFIEEHIPYPFKLKLQ